MNTPVTVTIITYAPTTFYHCQHCELTFQEVGLGERLHRQEAAQSLPEDLAREFAQLSDWTRELMGRHGPRVHLDVLDAVSIRGILSSLRHGAFRHPVAIVDGQTLSIRTPADYRQVDALIDRKLSPAAA
jgi:hypothetical protein